MVLAHFTCAGSQLAMVMSLIVKSGSQSPNPQMCVRFSSPPGVSVVPQGAALGDTVFRTLICLSEVIGQ